MKIAAGADHGGFALKQAVVRRLRSLGHEVIDVGPTRKRCPSTTPCTGTRSRRWWPPERSSAACSCAARASASACRPTATKASAPPIASRRTSPRWRGVTTTPTCSAWVAASSARTRPGRSPRSGWTRLRGRPSRAPRRASRRGGACLSPVGREWRREPLYHLDPELNELLRSELIRQQETLELIASENFASRAVLEATGSVLTNKYAEGTPGARYYGGCEVVDQVEQLAIDRCKEVFGAEHVNVQPHSGSSANLAALFALLEPGDTMMAMELAHGGHLTHGLGINYSGRTYNVVPYHVRPDTELVDMDEVRALASSTGRSSSSAATAPTRASSISPRSARSPTSAAPCSSPTSLTSPASSPPACTPTRSRTAMSSRARRTRRSRVRAPASSCAARSTRRPSTGRCSPACRAARSCT